MYGAGHVGTTILLALSFCSILDADAGQLDREARYQSLTQFASLIKGGAIHPHWLPDGNSFWYAAGTPDSVVIYRVDPTSNSKASLFDVTRVRAALVPLLGHAPRGRGLPFEEFSFVDGDRKAKFSTEGREFILNFATYEIREDISATPAARELLTPRVIDHSPRRGDVFELASPDSRWFLSHKDRNLWLRSGIDDQTVQLQADGEEKYEWLIGGGWRAALWKLQSGTGEALAKWSADGTRVAAFKVDSRKVRVQPLVNWLEPDEAVEWFPHPTPGSETPRLELHVVEVATKRTVKIDSGTGTYAFLRILDWRPDGRELFFFRMSRDFRQLHLMAADPTSGTSRVVLTERSKTFVEGVPRDWSNLFVPMWERQQLLWLSERDGWRHIYLYGVDGTLITQLTAGNFPVTRIVAVDAKQRLVYFLASTDQTRPYDTHLHRIDFDGNGLTRLTTQPGQHAIVFSPSRKFFIDTHSDIDRPPVVDLLQAAGERLQTLSVADTSALTGLRRWAPERFVAKAADGATDLHGVLFKPYDFDPARKYPILEVAYPGEQVASVPQTFSLNSLGERAQAWAELGFITFIVDARGTPGRGKAFQDVVYLNHGRNEIPDHAAVVRQLARERPYMDSTRVGMWGHSWGGYFAIRAMLLAPDVYHVAVASAPGAELTEYPYLFVEPFMLTPEQNPLGYDYGSNIKLADRLRGRLLLLVGSNDEGHNMGRVFRMADAFVRAGKTFDMMVLPGQGHGYTADAGRFAEAYVRSYFVTHLRADMAMP